MTDNHSNAHYHADEQGVLRRCYHKCRTSWRAWLVLAAFWVASTEPVEQHLWSEVTPFKQVAEFVHLPVDTHGG